MTVALEAAGGIEERAEDGWGPVDRQRANRRYLDDALHRIRLLLERRVLWLRSQRRSAPAALQRLAISDQQVDRLLAPGSRAAELEFYRSHEPARRIGDAVRRLDERLDEQLAAAQEAGAPLPIDLLQRGFQLGSLERDVLLLCLAPQLDPAFETLYAYAQDDAARRAPTPHLAHCLLAGDHEEPPLPAGWLRSQAPLRRCRVIQVDSRDSAAGITLRLEERIADYLQGVDELDPRVASLLSVPAAAPLGRCHTALVDELSGWLLRQLEESARPRLNLVGRGDSGKRAVARALCDRCRMRLLVLDLDRATGADRELWAALERECVLGQFLLYADATTGFDPSGGDSEREARRRLDELLLRLEAPVVLGSRKPWRADWPILVATVERPDGEERRAVWSAAVAAAAPPADDAARLDLDRIAEQFDFGPTTIAAIAGRARQRALLRPPPDDALRGEDLWAACRETAAAGLDELAQRIVPCFGWDDLVLPAALTRQLREIAAQVANRHRVYTEWRFAGKMPRGRGISALFSGPSGTGKTMAAEVLARELDLYLYRVDLSGVVSKYIGETEKNLRRVFDAAEGSGAVLFFDEADALFGKRSEVKDSHDRYANVEIDYLLQRMEEYRGLAILATNLRSHLDSAFLRRLRFVVELPAPDPELRRRIWERSLPPSAPAAEIDWAALAKLRITGGNIRNIAVNAAFLAADRGQPIGMAHLMQAAVAEYVKEERLISAGEFGAYLEVARREGWVPSAAGG